MTTETGKGISMSAQHPLGRTELLLFAEQISTGKLLAEKRVAILTEQFIRFYERPYGEYYTDRLIAAKAAGVLASHSPEALDLVMKSAEYYAKVQCEYDANPYRPNSITVLSEEGPRCEKVIAFLEGLAKTYRGMADGDVTTALLALGAGAGCERSAGC